MKLAAWLAFTACTSLRALDFTPVEVKTIGEGGEYSYLMFKDEKHRVTYMPPRNWTWQGGGSKFSLSAPDAGGSEIDITMQTVAEPLPAEMVNLKAFEDLARQSLPPGSKKVESVASFNPIEIDGRKTVEVTLSYGFFGQALKASHVYLMRDKAMMRFSVVARPADFERVRRTFHASLHTLAGL